jgi:hypothetical protein
LPNRLHAVPGFHVPVPSNLRCTCGIPTVALDCSREKIIRLE